MAVLFHKSVHRFLIRLHRNTSGNILIMTSSGMLLICFALGFVVDYSRAQAVQTRLNSIADAAALSAVDPLMIYRTDAEAQTAAQNMFNAQAAKLTGITKLQVAVPAPVTANGVGGLRTVYVGYTAESINIFGNILGLATLSISGSASASASQPPNINFYVVVDNSVSMLTPATSTGVSQLQATTNAACAFVCHTRTPQTGVNSYNYLVTKYLNGGTNNVWIPDSTYTSPVTQTSGLTYMLIDSNRKVRDSSGNLMSGYAICTTTGIPYTATMAASTSVSYPTAVATNGNNCAGSTISGQYADGYWAVENYSLLYPGNSNITLKIDDASNAVQQLGPYAYQTSQTNNATYGIQEFFYNSSVTDPQDLYPALPSGATQLSGTPVVQMTPMTTLTNSNSFTAPTIPVTRWINPNCMTTLYCPNNGSYSGPTTNNTGMFNAMSTLMPNPGNGTKGSTPQEVLFLITDGYDDYDGSNRGPFTSSQLAQCKAMKARGIKIAIIYTQYLASSVSSIYPNYAAVLTPTDQVAAALQQCSSTNASGAPLFFQVSQNQSITPALQQLFASVVQNAYLLQ